MGIKIVIYCTLLKKVEHVSNEHHHLEDMQLNRMKSWQNIFMWFLPSCVYGLGLLGAEP